MTQFLAMKCQPRGLVGRLWAANAAVLASLVVAGCGYTLGHEDNPRTVAVEVAGNATFRQRLELPLTRALQEAVVVYSAMQPHGGADADAKLVVEIEDARNRVLVSGRPEPQSEGSLAIAVEARLVDNRTGVTLRQIKVTDRAEFRVAIGEGESTAVRETATDLARKIVLGLEGDF